MPRNGRRQQQPPPPVYQDGLIPTAGDYHTYPEVVPEDHVPAKNEKSYPELAADQPQSYPQRTPPAVSPPSTESTAVHSPLAAPPMIGHQPLPRTSGVHSLRNAWSVDGGDDGLPPEERVPFWKRPIVWVILIALVIIVALAGILGGVATGSIKTALVSNSQTSSSPTPTPSITTPSSSTPTPTHTPTSSSPGTATATPSAIPSVTDPTCPSSNNRNYTASTSSSSSSSSSSTQKTFRIQCGVNYPGGDGSLGLQNATAVTTANITTFAGCLDLCAQKSDCVGAVFNTAVQCWLKQAIGQVVTGTEGTDSAVLYQGL